MFVIFVSFVVPYIIRCLMRDKPCAIHLQHQHIVHHPNLSRCHKLHLALMCQRIDRQTHAVALVHMASLGEKADEERLALHMGGGLRMHIPRNLLLGARVYPLPFFRVGAEVGV